MTDAGEGLQSSVSQAAGEEDGIDDLIDSLTTGPRASTLFRSRRAVVVFGVVCLLGIVGSVVLSAAALLRSGDSEPGGPTVSTVSESSETAASGSDDDIGRLNAVVQGFGLTDVTAERRGSVVYLTGSVASESDRASAIGAAEALFGVDGFDASELVVREVGSVVEEAPDEGAGDSERAGALRAELERITAVTPLIFDQGESALTELQKRILNNLAAAIQAYPELPVTIIGYTDDRGTDEANKSLSLTRAGNVQTYLIAQGVPATRLTVEARGEEGASGSSVLASLERRVEFEVADGGGGQLAPNEAPLRIAIVAPSPSNDLAFTQSMVDAVNVLAEERGNVEVAITDNTFIPSEAAAAVRGYADQDYDLVIAHGVEFGADLIEIVREYPNVTFAWGTATDTFGLPNLYAYDAAAEQGGYVMGAMSASLSSSDVVGVVGPIEVGDAVRYVEGFEAGATSQAEPTSVLVEYTGSFADIALAAEVANSHVSSGADVLTGTAEMVIGAVAVAEENDVLWFGTQASQESLAPSIVVASQVYHWEVVLRPIVRDIDNGTVNGTGLIADMANGGLIIEYNPAYGLPADVRQQADQLTAQIINGSLIVPFN